MNERKITSIWNEELRHSADTMRRMEALKNRWLRTVERETSLDQAAVLTNEERKKISETIMEIAQVLGIQRQLSSLLDVLDSRSARIRALEKATGTEHQEGTSHV